MSQAGPQVPVLLSLLPRISRGPTGPSPRWRFPGCQGHHPARAVRGVLFRGPCTGCVAELLCKHQPTSAAICQQTVRKRLIPVLRMQLPALTIQPAFALSVLHAQAFIAQRQCPSPLISLPRLALSAASTQMCRSTLTSKTVQHAPCKQPWQGILVFGPVLGILPKKG